MCPPPDAVADVPPWPEANPVRGECVVCFVDRMTPGQAPFRPRPPSTLTGRS